MKLVSLLFVGCLFAAAGCNSERKAERQAVSDAEQVAAFYLPKLLQDTNLSSKQVFPPSWPSRAAPLASNEKRKRELVQRLSNSQEQRVENLRSLGKQAFRGLTGQGYTGPAAWNIQGHHYLEARREAVFGQTAFTVSLLVMHPDHYARYMDWGVEVANDPQKTGVAGVGKLKFLLGTLSIVSTNELPPERSKAVGQPQFIIRDRLRVFVSHSGVRR